MRDYQILHQDSEHFSISVVVPETSRFFTGHFPGRPILPAIAHLELVDRLLQVSFGKNAFIESIELLRLRDVVLPGDRIEIRLMPIENSSTPSARFTITRSDEPVSEGLLSWTREIQ